MKKIQQLIFSLAYFLIPFAAFRHHLEESHVEKLLLSGTHRQRLLEKYLNWIFEQRATNTGFIETQLAGAQHLRVLVLEQDSNLHGRRFFIESLFGKRVTFLDPSISAENAGPVDLIITLGYSSMVDHIQLLYKLRHKPSVFLEAAFLRSILMDKSSSRFDRAICFFIDDLGHHYDPNHPSRIEYQLNQPDFSLSAEQKDRAKALMRSIVDNKLTKYNNQPVVDLDIGRPGKEKILVIEQARNDWAIVTSGGKLDSFESMLEKAITENPDADILVKIHPDTLDGKRGGVKKSYYGDRLQGANIYKITQKINPYSLLDKCSKVYVFSSMFGFEALMAGKEVHVFGLPCYAGWGLTVDEKNCARRHQHRTLEEVVYAIFFSNTYYLDEQGRRCEPEQAVDYLLALRDEFQASGSQDL